MRRVVCFAGVLLIGLVAGNVAAYDPAGTPVLSVISEFAPDDGAADRHRYAITVAAGSTIEVLLRSSEVDTFVEAVLPDGRRLTNDDYDGLDAGFIQTIFTGGIVEVIASPLIPSQIGAYELTIIERPSDGEIGAGETVVSVLSREMVAGDLEGGDPSSGALPERREGSRAAAAGVERIVDRYLLRGRRDQRVVIDLSSDDFDAFLRVNDGDGREAVDDDGGAGPQDSRLAWVFERDGTLLIEVGSFSGGGEGSYTLRVADKPLVILASYRGRLEPGDDRAYDGKFVDTVEYAAVRGETVTVELSSDDFDAYLSVAAFDGLILDQNDDGGTGSDALVTVTFPDDGRYRFYVTSYAEATGAYRLSVYR